MRFWIAFARPHENAIVTDNNTTLSVHAHIMVSLSVTLFFSKAGDGNENGKKKRFILEKQELCTCSTLFCTFLCHHCRTATWNSLKWRFVADVNTDQTTNFSFSLLNLVAVPKNSIPGKFTYIRLRFYTSRKNRDQHLSLLNSAVFATVAVVVDKAPYYGAVKNLPSGGSICKMMRFRCSFSPVTCGRYVKLKKNSPFSCALSAS